MPGPPTTNPVEEQLRTIYAAFSEGNMAGVLCACSDATVFHVPGRSSLAGDYLKATFMKWCAQCQKPQHSRAATRGRPCSMAQQGRAPVRFSAGGCCRRRERAHWRCNPRSG